MKHAPEIFRRAHGKLIFAVAHANASCWVEIRTRALEENMRFLASLAAPHAELLAMVKANA